MNDDTERSLLLADPDRFKALYFELILFFGECGGVYQRPSRRFCSCLLWSLDYGQFYLKRDQSAQITEFCNFWLIDPADLEAVRGGCRPVNVSTGRVLYIVDHGNKSGTKGLYSMIRSLRHKSISGVAWRHKGGEFRYFPRQKGGN